MLMGKLMTGMTLGVKPIEKWRWLFSENEENRNEKVFYHTRMGIQGLHSPLRGERVGRAPRDQSGRFIKYVLRRKEPHPATCDFCPGFLRGRVKLIANDLLGDQCPGVYK